MRCAGRFGWLAGTLLVPAVAHAEDIPLLPEDPPQIEKRYTAVLERVQPGYVAPGIPLGGFTLSPSLGISTGYNDNIYATQTGAVADGFTEIKPQALLASNWSRNSVSIDARGTIDRYFTRSSENVADYMVTGAGEWDISADTSFRAAVRTERDHQSRLSQDIYALTTKPVAYQEQSAEAELIHDINRLRLTADVRLANFDWQNGEQADGEVVDQRTSDDFSYRVGVKAAYEQSTSFTWFVSGSFNNRNFRYSDAQTPQRDSSGYQLLAGLEFEPAALVRGSIGIGYIQQNFRLHYYTNISGMAFNARVQFFPTQLTTITLKGDRQVLDSGIPGSGGYLSSEGTIEVDHELLRQLILTASVGYQNNKFNNLDRIDDRVEVTASATYKLNRYAALTLHYDRLDQSSHGTDRYRAYVDNRLMIGLSLRR